MRLKDLVANSLPRMRGRKKKPPPMSSLELVPSVQRDLENQPSLSSSSFSPTQGAHLDKTVLAETTWQGNALYRGMEVSRQETRGHGGSLMLHDYRSRGMVASHSTEGFSSEMMLMSQNYDARMAVSEYGGSLSHLSTYGVVNQPLRQPPQQYYHCYVHTHDHRHHHHYHHHHHHMQQSQPMQQLSQNQQTCSNSSPSQTQKSEPGFFRKSFASFRSIRKKSSKHQKEKECASVCQKEGIRCSTCPYPEASFDTNIKNNDKKPTKPKRKGFKSFSRHKENAGQDKFDRPWLSDTEDRNYIRPIVCDNSGPYHVAMDRSQMRACSIDSCSSRFCGSRESSCVRDTDLMSVNSMSMSEHGSDVSRSKVQRSRSRIKTNPWLPSPLTTNRKSREFRESQEDMMVVEDVLIRPMPRSASFEYRRKPSLQTFAGKDSRQDVPQSMRSITPSKVNSIIDVNCNQSQMTSENSTITGQICSTELNDLSSEPSRSRPTSIVSPTSEFTKLTDNIEQLATNISFEYEDMLDSNLETTNAFQDQGGIPEILTDEDSLTTKSSVSSKSKRAGKSKSSQRENSFPGLSGATVNNDHSPDSGVSGLSMSDTDGVSPTGGENIVKMDFSNGHSNESSSDRCFKLRSNNTLSVSSSESLPKRKKENSKRPDSFTSMRLNISKNSVSEDGFFPGVCESDIDNTSYQDTTLDRKHTKSATETQRGYKGVSNQSLCLMVNEKLDIPYQHVKKRTRDGNCIKMGSRVKSKEDSQQRRSSKSSVITQYSNTSMTASSSQHSSLSDQTMNMKRKQKSFVNSENVFPESKDEQQWLHHHDFPRNINFTELLESPTDNCQYDIHQYHRTGQVSQISGASTHLDPSASPLTQLKAYHLAYSTEDRNINQGSHQNDQVTSFADEVNLNGMDYLPGKDVQQEMPCDLVDACCQTEFDEDDLVCWVEPDLLHGLDQTMVDRSENTRMWLLTGSMNDSADTGYSSLARDSRVISDDDCLPSNELSNSDTFSDLMACATKITKDENSDSKSTRSKEGSNSSSVILDSTNKKQDNKRKTKRKSLTKVNSSSPPDTPKETLNEMFSNIESQFEELFQQMSAHTGSKIRLPRRYDSTDSSSTIKSNGSRQSVADIDMDNDDKSCDTNATEKGGKSCKSKNGKCYKTVNKESSCVLDSKVNPSKKNNKLPDLTSQHDPTCKGDVSRSSNTETKVFNEKPTGSDIEHSGHDDMKADYLAFLRDEPLEAPLPKHPIFLVPGVGPVDMSNPDSTAILPDENAMFKYDKETLMTLQDDPETRSLAERVMILRQEKEDVFRKLKDVQGDEVGRQEQELHHQRQVHDKRKQALLDSLRELKKRLEEQSHKLQAPEATKS